jgi:glycosyltransferase involved in cell wall biosynthesis
MKDNNYHSALNRFLEIDEPLIRHFKRILQLIPSDEKENAIYYWLKIIGDQKFPSPKNIEIFSAKTQEVKSVLIHKMIRRIHTEIRKDKNYLKNAFELPQYPKQIFIDMSFAVESMMISGIFRVTKSLAENILDIDPRIGVFAYHYRNHVAHLVDIKIFRNLENDLKKYKAKVKEILLKHSKMLLLVTRFIYKMIRVAWQIIKQNDPLQNHKPLLPIGAHIIVTEMTDQIERYSQYNLWHRYLLTSYSLVVHDLIPVYYPEFCPRSYEFLYYMQMLKVSDHIICVSNTVKKSVQGWLEGMDYFDVHKKPEVKTVYLGRGFKTRQLNINYNLSSRKTILYVSSLEPRKNHMRLIEAVFLLSKQYDFHLILVGNMTPDGQEISEKAKSYGRRGLSYSIKISVSDSELDRLYGEAYFTVFPSLTEGFGLPIIESIEYGKPCVCSNLGSMKELASKLGGCHLVNPYSVESIKHGIEKLLSNERYYERLKNEALNAKWHSWKDYATQVYKIVS